MPSHVEVDVKVATLGTPQSHHRLSRVNARERRSRQECRILGTAVQEMQLLEAKWWRRFGLHSTVRSCSCSGYDEGG